MTSLDTVADKLLAECRPRAKSLIVTVIGDALVTHGGVAWMASFITLGGLLGLNERLVRTAVQRLVADGWLTSESHGRRAAYRVTETGLRRVSEAGHRIYAADLPEWDGEWRLLFTGLGDCDAATKDRLRKELLWLGFGQVAPGVFARPKADYDEVVPILKALGVAGSVAPLRGRSLPGHGDADRILARAWNLETLAGDYRSFVSRFTPLDQVLAEGAETSGEAAFKLRMLLMHEFRRVVLRDPMLPAALMEADWIGHRARQLAACLYNKLAASSTGFMVQTIERPDGRKADPEAAFFKRFGGIALRQPASV